MSLRHIDRVGFPKRPLKCPNCGEVYPHFTWDYSLSNSNPAIVDGRHCMNEIQVHVTLGCDTCSETLAILPLGEFLAQTFNALPDTGVSQPTTEGNTR